jgi:hypothetical protein
MMKTKKATKNPQAVEGFGYYWPGPMRLYDADVDAGAVLLCGEHAKALVLAVADALRSGDHDDATRRHMVTAVGILNTTFRLGIGDSDRLKPGTMVRWAGGGRWRVIEWQPHNGIGGAYWLRNQKGEDAVAGPEEVKVVRPAKRKVKK